MKSTRFYVAAAVLAALALGGVASAQGDLTLEGLAEQVKELFASRDEMGQRLAAIETAIAPTWTPKPTAIWTATPSPEAIMPSLLTRRRLRVMSGPGPNYDHLGWAEKEVRFEITGKNLAGNWWQVIYNGAPGWVFGGHVYRVSHYISRRVAVVPTPTLMPTNTPQTAPTASATPTPEGTARLVIGRKMNVRSGPGTQHEISGTAEAGAEYAIRGRNLEGDWWQIDYEGVAGWVYAPYVTAVDAEEAAIVATPTREPTATPRPTSAPVPTATVADPGIEAIERVMQALKAETGAQQETLRFAFLLALNDYEGIGGSVRPWGSFFRLPEEEIQQRITYYIPRFEAAMKRCDVDADKMFWIINSNANKLELAGIAQAQGWSPRAEWIEFLSINEIPDQNGLLNPCEELVASRTWEILDQYSETQTPDTPFATNCAASVIDLVEVRDVSNAIARRFQLLASMGPGCDQADALAFASHHSASMMAGTEPFHVLFYDFMCASNYNSGLLDVAFIYAPYGELTRADEIALGNYSKHEMKLVHAFGHLPCP